MRPYSLRICLASIIVVASAQAQITFQDLDFEGGQLVPVPGSPGLYNASSAIPGWTAYMSGVPQSAISLDGGSLMVGHAYLTLIGPPNTAFQGRYTFSFAAGVDQSSQATIPVSLSQTAQVPADAKSLQFLASYAPTVTLGGQQLTVIPLSTGPLLGTVFGADISGFAGQTLELSFAPSIGFAYLDDVRFSSAAIPEPSAISLGLAFVSLFALHHLRRR